MEEQLQQQPTPQPAKPKKKFYKKWWLWLVVILIILLVVVYIRNSSLTGVCSKESGWEHSPCTGEHKSVEEESNKEIITELRQSGGCVKSWDTEYGRIFATVYTGSTDLFSTLIKPAHAQIHLDDVCYGYVTGGSYANYYNSKGQYIATCIGEKRIDLPKDAAVCKWLLSLDMDKADYQNICCDF